MNLATKLRTLTDKSTDICIWVFTSFLPSYILLFFGLKCINIINYFRYCARGQIAAAAAIAIPIVNFSFVGIWYLGLSVCLRIVVHVYTFDCPVTFRLFYYHDSIIIIIIILYFTFTYTYIFSYCVVASLIVIVIAVSLLLMLLLLLLLMPLVLL